MVPNAEIEILLIDDNRADNELALDELKSLPLPLNNVIQTLTDAETALDYLLGEKGSSRKAIPKVILLDLHLHKMNGLELLSSIKQNPQTRDIPVLVLKASISPAELAECERLGVSGYIDKPVNLDSLTKAITNIGRSWNRTDHTFTHST